MPFSMSTPCHDYLRVRNTNYVGPMMSIERIFSPFSTPTPLALVVNKSPAVFTFIRALEIPKEKIEGLCTGLLFHLYCINLKSLYTNDKKCKGHKIMKTYLEIRSDNFFVHSSLTGLFRWKCQNVSYR